MRVLIGLFSSTCFPSAYHFFPSWVPIKEKTVMIPMVASGMYIGEIIGFSVSGYLINSTIHFGEVELTGWPTLFYLFGLVGILWFPLWMYMSSETPQSHPTITADELAYLTKGFIITLS